LIELLVVILIIGILIAVSAPSFLGQTQKAHDSEAKQYLTIAYRNAVASATDRDGAFIQGSFTATDLASAIQAAEPALTVQAVTGPCAASADGNPKHIFVAADTTTAADLELCNDPTHTVWTLRVLDHVLQPLTSAVTELGAAPGDPGTSTGDYTRNAFGGPTCVTDPVNYDALSAEQPTTVEICYQLQGPLTVHEFSVPANPAPAPPSGWTFFGRRYKINSTGPDPDAGNNNQLVLALFYDSDLLPATVGSSAVEIFRNGTEVPPCVTNTPDEQICVQGTNSSGNNRAIVIFFPAGSSINPSDSWNYGYPTCSLAATGQAAKPLTFISDRATQPHGGGVVTNSIYTMNADGSGTVAMTNTCAATAVSQLARSADGSHLLFTAGSSGSNSSLYELNADGSGLRHVTTNADGSPGTFGLSPDGQKIFYLLSGGGNLNLHVSDSDGSNDTTTPFDNSLFPNGYQYGISFLGNSKFVVVGYDNALNLYALYTMNLDGSNLTPLITDSASQIADLSASDDGSRIAYGVYDSATGRESVHTIASDGSQQVDIPTVDGAYDQIPLLNSDGSSLAFVSSRDDLVDGNNSLYVATGLDGTPTVTLLVSDIHLSGNYAWSPGSDFVVYGTSQDDPPNYGRFQLYKVRVSDGQTTRLTNTLATAANGDDRPTWR
jgi:Tol biopolymer transport system component/type II secretory pathway pseudopilin PulG